MEKETVFQLPATFEEQKEEFKAILLATGRAGMDKLLSHLENDGFFDTPARASHAGAHPHGLLEYSLLVYRVLQYRALNDPVWAGRFNPNSVAIVSLLHAVYKMGLYKGSTKNVKVYKTTDNERFQLLVAQGEAIRSDSTGAFIWDTEQSYVIDDSKPLGTGEASVIHLLYFIRLTEQEMFAIRWHRGYERDRRGTVSNAMSYSPLAVALHSVINEVTFFVEPMIES